MKVRSGNELQRPDTRAERKGEDGEDPEDILALAKEEGYELSIDELDAVSGGWGGEDPCPSYAGCDDLS